MPTNKDAKRLVRRRMRKTGESYTTARANLLKQKPAAALSADPFTFAKLAGRSDVTMKENTGCTWERWVKALDRVQAHTWAHRDIAAHVQEKYKVSGWWAQTVTVGYERIKGLRAIGQRRDGWFEANQSKTFAVSLARLYAAFHDPRVRGRWLSGVELTVRTATRGKSMRITWPDRTSVAVGFLRLGVAKSQVQLQHGRLPDRATATRVKQFWAERLGVLEDTLKIG